MFTEAINRINIKISKNPNKKKLVKLLENKIMSNDILKTQWEAYKFLKSKKNKIYSEKEFNSLVENLGSKTINNQKVLFTEVSKLLNEFKINPETVLPNKIDEALSGNKKNLINLTVDKRDVILKENFKRIISERDQEELNYNLKVINFYNSSFNGVRKKMISESIKNIKGKKADFKTLAIKAYKLRKLTESLLFEKVINSKIEDIGIFKNINIQLLDEKLVLNFKINVTPVAKNCQKWFENALTFKKKLVNSQSVFLNQCVKQTVADNDIDTDYTLWNVKMLSRVMRTEDLLTTTPASFKIFLNLKHNIDAEASRSLVRLMLEKFELVLKEYLENMVDYLTPAKQTELFNSLQGKLNTRIDLRKGNKINEPKKVKEPKTQYFNVDDFAKDYFY